MSYLINKLSYIILISVRIATLNLPGSTKTNKFQIHKKNEKTKNNKPDSFVSSGSLTCAGTGGCTCRNTQTNRQVTGCLRFKNNAYPFNGIQFALPLTVVPGVKNGAETHFAIPDSLLPGEFLIRFDYRAKETDTPYPAELQLYINREDIGVDANPLNLHGDSLHLTNDRENKAWFAFAGKSEQQRQQIGLLRQLLEQYDRPSSSEWNAVLKAYEKRRVNYNRWVDSLAQTQKDLYVSHLYGFQQLKAENWKATPATRMDVLAREWFNSFNFNDPLILRSRQMNELMNGFMGLYGMRATTEALRDSLFTEAGRLACAKASVGHPRVYGWMVDYFYNGYETYNITKGMAMLENNINNPRCLTSKKMAIAKRIEGLNTLVPGVTVSDILVHNFDDREEIVNITKCDKEFRLLVFYDSECSHCTDLLAELRKWYELPANSAQFDIVSIALDRTREVWEPAFTANAFPWMDRYAPGGINSQAASDYYVLSAPYMYVVDKDGVLLSIPTTIEELDGMMKK